MIAVWPITCRIVIRSVFGDGGLPSLLFLLLSLSFSPIFLSGVGIGVSVLLGLWGLGFFPSPLKTHLKNVPVLSEALLNKPVDCVLV